MPALRVFQQTTVAFVDEVKKAFAAGDIRDDADPTTLARSSGSQ